MSTQPGWNLSLGPCMQVGIVVRDLDRTIRRLTELFGIGPFQIITYPPPDREDIQTSYHSKPGSFKFRQAFADLGSIELEIIQPLRGKNIWSDFLAAHGEGIHHIRFNVPEWDETLAYLKEHDVDVLQSGSGLRRGTQWANLNTEEEIGFIIEIMKPVPGTNGRTPANIEGMVQVDTKGKKLVARRGVRDLSLGIPGKPIGLARGKSRRH